MTYQGKRKQFRCPGCSVAAFRHDRGRLVLRSPCRKSRCGRTLLSARLYIELDLAFGFRFGSEYPNSTLLRSQGALETRSKNKSKGADKSVRPTRLLFAHEK